MSEPHAFDPGPPPILTWLPVSGLLVDRSYQRTLETRASQLAIEEIALNFSWECFGALTVARTDDGDFIIDGQHRAEAAGRRNILQVPCIVIVGASVEKQARIFLATNRTRVAVNPFAMFHARLAANDARARDVDAMCREVGVEIPKYPMPLNRLKPRQTLALKQIEKIGTDPDNECGREALRLIGRVWGDEPGAFSVKIILALSRALAGSSDAGLANVEGWMRQRTASAVNLEFSGAGGIMHLAERLKAVAHRTVATFAPGVSRAQLMGGR